jgi:hypothetical protein
MVNSVIGAHLISATRGDSISRPIMGPGMNIRSCLPVLFERAALKHPSGAFGVNDAMGRRPSLRPENNGVGRNPAEQDNHSQRLGYTHLPNSDSPGNKPILVDPLLSS